jgi:photosystem II stability/assembly factor-like uncharacterized protein
MPAATSRFAVIPYGRIGRIGLGLAAIVVALQGSPLSGQQKPPSPREQQIQEIQKQIDALTKKLNELKQAPAPATVAGTGALDPNWIKTMTWRSIGPAAMGGRIVALSVFEADPSTYFVATASGGLLKTTNNGVTFEHQFDRESTVAIGDVCVAPSDKNIVWVGTGENNPRNSVSFGDGVYKSTDGGKTWKNMGLKRSFQVGKIFIHPKNPDIVYVGALGRLYGPNEERGLYKTTDGGKTWKQILYVDDKTGVIDMRMNPADPETLLVATWERQRDGFDSMRGEPPVPDGYDAYDPIKKYGPGTMLFKTTDGGANWKRITKGLPPVSLGRMGLDYYRKDPNIVYLVLDSEKMGMGPPPTAAGGAFMGIQGEDADAGARLKDVSDKSPAAKGGLKAGDIILAVDNEVIVNYKQLGEVIRKHKAGDKLKVKVSRNKESKEFEVTLEKRPASGGNPKRPFGFFYGGQRENVQDKQGPDGWQTGGVYKSTDGGESWTRINSLNPRPMYFSQIRVDPSDDKYLYVLGIALYRSSDGGKTFKPDGGKEVHPDQHALWIDPRDGRHMIVGCDGGFYATYDRMDNWDFLNHLAIGQFYHVAVDTKKPYHVYGGMQDNGSWGGPSRVLHGGGSSNDDWYMVIGGDGFVCRVDPTDPDLVYAESQDGHMFRRNLKTGEFAGIRPKEEKGKAYRFNWNTPFILSSHNPRIFYAAGNYVFRSVKQGDDLRVISPELSRSKRGTATALAESPLNPNVLWVGTDDGNLWITRDGGNQWTNLADKVGLPGPRWVATIEASRFAEGRAYVVFDAHRSDDDEPYVYVTEDFGASWKSLRANLPVGSTRVLREDVKNADLLFLGTEFAAWGSVDRGKSWTKLNNNLPTVAIHEFAIHPTAGEIVAATHGRSMWVLDIVPLRQMTEKVLKARANLFGPSPAIRWRSEPARGPVMGAGSRRFVGQNPPRGAQIYYSLAGKADKISLKIVDHTGATVRELQVKKEPGLHRVSWDLIKAPGLIAGVVQRIRGQQKGQPSPAQPGLYRVVLNVDGQDYTQNLRVEPDPVLPPNLIASDKIDDEEDDEMEEMEREEREPRVIDD